MGFKYVEQGKYIHECTATEHWIIRRQKIKAGTSGPEADVSYL
jgi:hypothetical protein